MRARTNKSLNYSSILLLFLMLLLTSLKIQSTKWIENLFLLNWITFGGYLVGILLGFSRFKSFLAGTLIFLYSIIFIPWSIGITYDSSIGWLSRLENIFGRIIFSIQQLNLDSEITDPILFFVFLSTLIWFTALFAGFSLVRKSKPWVPILFSAITIFAGEIYDQPANYIYTGFFIFFLLLLISRISFWENGKIWKSQRIPIDVEAESLIRKSSFIVALVIVFLSWNITTIVSAFQKDSPENKQVIGFIAEIQSQLSKITAPIQGNVYIQTEFFGNTVDLGTGSQLTEEVIFEISVNQSKPTGVRYYWKGKSYDTFTNNKWESTFTGAREFSANELIPISPEIETLTKRTFNIKTFKNLGILYAPQYPQRIDRPIIANFEYQTPENIEIVSLTLDKITFPGETYSIETIITNPTITQLRKSTQDYPEWLTEKYLQLPGNFSENVANLAVDLTKIYDNPYDKVEAITNYLRENITYNEQIPEPPVDQEIVDWFLFDLKEGFCNYYATAEVMMLRSVGIPARISFGYAQGESLDPNGTDFIVRREQLHAWPEVYFQGFGWVIFEPTTIQPSIERFLGESPENIESIPTIPGFDDRDIPLIDGGENIPLIEETPENVIQPINEDPEIIEENDGIFNPSGFKVFLILLGVFGVILLLLRKPSKKIIDATPVVLEAFLIKRGWRIPSWLQIWARYSSLPEEAKAFSNIIWAISLHNTPLQKSLTPQEIVSRYNQLFPEMSEISNITLEEYQKALFSREPIDLELIQLNTKKLLMHSIHQKVALIFKFRHRLEKI